MARLRQKQPGSWVLVHPLSRVLSAQGLSLPPGVRKAAILLTFELQGLASVTQELRKRAKLQVPLDQLQGESTE